MLWTPCQYWGENTIIKIPTQWTNSNSFSSSLWAWKHRIQLNVTYGVKCVCIHLWLRIPLFHLLNYKSYNKEYIFTRFCWPHKLMLVRFKQLLSRVLYFRDSVSPSLYLSKVLPIEFHKSPQKSLFTLWGLEKFDWKNFWQIQRWTNWISEKRPPVGIWTWRSKLQIVNWFNRLWLTWVK